MKGLIVLSAVWTGSVTEVVVAGVEFATLDAVKDVAVALGFEETAVAQVVIDPQAHDAAKSCRKQDEEKISRLNGHGDEISKKQNDAPVLTERAMLKYATE